MYYSVKAAYERDEALSRISSLSYQAFKQGKKFKLTQYPVEQNETGTVEETSEFEDGTEYIESADESEFTIDDAENAPLKLKEGWTLRTNAPILFRANGVCSGGTIYLKYYEEAEFSIAEFSIRLTPPFCRASQLN